MGARELPRGRDCRDGAAVRAEGTRREVRAHSRRGHGVRQGLFRRCDDAGGAADGPRIIDLGSPVCPPHRGQLPRLRRRAASLLRPLCHRPLAGVCPRAHPRRCIRHARVHRRAARDDHAPPQALARPADRGAARPRGRPHPCGVAPSPRQLASMTVPSRREGARGANCLTRGQSWLPCAREWTCTLHAARSHGRHDRPAKGSRAHMSYRRHVLPTVSTVGLEVPTD
mmetsp:Transcript_16887/g.28755  ORF Transcript_16887/g.28755 Transcript_16887/m.28755 type:complete len:227 (+) Transcript_16887:458-1138(+)